MALLKLPAMYTFGPLTATEVASSVPEPPARCAHTNPALLFHLATKTSLLPDVLPNETPPKLAVPEKVPTRYTLPAASAVAAFTWEYPLTPCTKAIALCQVGVWAATRTAGSSNRRTASGKYRSRK